MAQWETFGNSVAVGDYLGADATSVAPLHLRTIPDLSIDFSTSDLPRMRLYPTQVNTGFTYYGGQNVTQSGFLGLSNAPEFFDPAVSDGPFSRLHLAQRTSAGASPNTWGQQRGYRRWMQNGITFTGNCDQGYIGQKYRRNEAGEAVCDLTDMVLQWSNDPDLEFGPDNLRFIFTATPNNAPSGWGSEEGLEGMRLFPESSSSVNVGIGDYYAASLGGSAVNPSHRLDVLTGQVRIRALPEPAGEVTASYKVMVVDDSPAPSAERGVVKWIDPADLPPTGGGGGADCDWTVLNPNTSGSTTVHHVYTAVGTSDLCPDASDNVGVGIVNPTAKLHVYRQVNSGAGNIGGRFHMTGSDGNKRSLFGLANGGGSEHCGVRGESSNGTSRNYGVHGLATTESDVSNTENYGLFGEAVVASGATNSRNTGSRAEGRVTGTATNNHAVFGRADVAGSSASVSDNHGVYAEARAYNFGTVGNNYGIKAEAITFGNGSTGTNYGLHAKATGGAVNYAGYFIGDVNITGIGYIPGGVWQSSDEVLKTDVEDLTGASDVLRQLTPRTYSYLIDAHPNAGLPEGHHAGLMAQELEALLPALVREVNIPAMTDSSGHVIAEAETIKAINYGGLIPYLISAFNEQQARLSQLEQALASCCAQPAGDQRMGLETPVDQDKALQGEERLLTIAPNPFTDRTTVSYTLERGGRAQLLVNSSDGKHLQVLEEGVRSEGQYNYTWSTAHLAPGVYYVTLLLDGEPLVKRAVKVQ